MNRAIWMGVFILALSCGSQPKPGLNTKPKDDGSKSLDKSSPYAEIRLKTLINDDGSTSYSLEFESNTELADTVVLKAGSFEIPLELGSTELTLDLSSDEFITFSTGPLQILNAASGHNQLNQNLESPKVLGQSPYDSIEFRDLINCENPQISWIPADVDFKVFIEIQRPATSHSTDEIETTDLGQWNSGFSSGEIYTTLLTSDERELDLFFDLVSQKVIRKVPDQKRIWLGSSSNFEIEFSVQSIEAQDRYLYHFAECP